MNIRGADTVVLDALLAKPYRLTLIASGAGAGIQSVLWNRAGTSNFLTGAYFPYDRKATQNLLGFEPEKSVSRKTAIQMAVEAYIRSCCGTGTGEALGLGLTAAVSTNRDRKGANVVDVALITPTSAYYYHLDIHTERSGQTREQKRIEDGLRADGAAFRILSHYLHVGDASWADGVEYIPQSELMEVVYERPLFLPNGERPLDVTAALKDYLNIVPTSANPPHAGHYGMAAELENAYGKRTVFAVTADSVHKPSLSAQELLQRVAYFRAGPVPVVLTRKDPLFIDKARQFPGRIFGIGVDTLERLLDPKWSTQPIEEMLAEFNALGTTFMVFDRNGKNMNHVIGKDSAWRFLFDRNEMSWDISSSQIRAAAS